MLVSVIVPIYNVVLEKFRECMYSLQNQTLKDIEIILVDDCGEMRECIDYANELSLTDTRIVFLKNEQNQGAGFSRNKGIKIARGEYLSFIDADDKIDLDFYEKLYKKTKEKKFDIIKGALFGARNALNDKIRNSFVQGKSLYEVFNSQHVTAIYRTAFIIENNIDYGLSRVSQDITFLLKVTVLAHTIALVDDAYYYYNRENQHSLTHTLLAENISHYCHAMQERMDFLVQHVDYKNPAFLNYIEFNTKRLLARADMLISSEVSCDKCLVSVIVPTYNAADYLPELISSLQKQTLYNIEIIFIDDGSTDASAQIIEEALQADKRISYYYQENAGAGTARNTGISHSNGKYIICIDADDLYDTNFLEELYKAGEAHNADAIMCLFRRHDYWKNLHTENEGYKKDILPINTVFNRKDIPKFCSTFNPGPINKMYRRKFIEMNQIKYASTRIANDVEFGYEAMLLADRIVCIPQNLLTVRRYINPNSISATRKEHLADAIKSVNGLWDWAEKKQLLEEKEQFLKIFGDAANYNSQYGVTDEFWDECCIFIKKITPQFFPLETVQKVFNINTRRFERIINEKEINGVTDKEVEMLNNRIIFVKKMKSYLDSMKSSNAKEHITEEIVLPSKQPPSQKMIKSADDFAPSKSSLLLRLKLLLARIWPVTIKRFNLSKADDRKYYLQQAKELKRIINKQEKQIKDTKKMLQTMYDCIRENQENTALLLSNINEKLCMHDTTSGDTNALLGDIKSIALESKATIQESRSAIQENKAAIQENKAAAEINNRQTAEVLWAEIFSDTIQNSSWLSDKTFSPGRWAVGYQYLYAMYRILNETKPMQILELGLGQSTKMIAQYAQYKKAEHIVVEHDSSWADFFKNSFSMPECSKIEICELTFVPYKKEQAIRVYDGLKERLGNKKFDFISIDAPRGGDMKQYARIDILQMLPDCLGENFVILLDDYNRSGEQQTVREIGECLKKNGIAYKKGTYNGMKDCILICAEHLRFLTTM